MRSRGLRFSRLVFCLRAVDLSRSLKGIRAYAVPTGRRGLFAPFLAGGGVSQQGRRRCIQALTDPSCAYARAQLGNMERLKAAAAVSEVSRMEPGRETEADGG